MEAVEAAAEEAAAAAAREADDGEEEPLSKGRSEREEKARLRVMGLGLYFSGCRVALFVWFFWVKIEFPSIKGQSLSHQCEPKNEFNQMQYKRNSGFVCLITHNPAINFFIFPIFKYF